VVFLLKKFPGTLNCSIELHVVDKEFVTVKPFGAPRCHLGESPRWAYGHWWWVDASIGNVYWRPGSSIEDLGKSPIGIKHFNARTSLVQPVGGFQLVIAVENTLRRFTFDTGEITEIGSPIKIPLPNKWLLNDGIVDGVGNIWIGSVSPDRSPGTGALLRITPDGDIDQALPRFSLTNGMAWDLQKSNLFHVDSCERKIWRHHIHALTGSIDQSDIFLQLPSDDGLPDGISFGPSGNLFVAIYGKSVVRSYDKNARLLYEIPIPTEQVTSVAFGGESNSQLLITTAQEDFTEDQSQKFPLAGTLFISER
jgi:sugar lactone lactonase YvrE